MNGFVKVSNRIFDYNLSPKALFVYTYLCSRVSCLQTTSVNYKAISKACNMDVKTICSAISELEGNALVAKQNRYNCKGYIANRYYVTNLIKDNKGWFKLDREVFRTDIKATDLMVYCFIVCKMCSDNMQSFPSLSAICAGTSISRGRVSKAIQYLRSFTYLNRIKRHYRCTRAYRHNRYIHFICNLKKCKRKARTSQIRTLQNQLICIINPFVVKHNTFLRI